MLLIEKMIEFKCNFVKNNDRDVPTWKHFKAASFSVFKFYQALFSAIIFL